jgi:GR25 family glycosyltransferase involved in LPS biosynthesis
MMMIAMYLVLILISISSSSSSSSSSSVVVSFPPVYWINLDNNIERRRHIENELKSLNVSYHVRVSALTKTTCNIIMLERTCRLISLSDIAILCSHLKALYTAVTDTNPYAINSKYALILEDDIHFKFLIDFNKLIEMAPPDFGMIQLMTSHTKHFESLWNTYKNSDYRNLFTMRGKDTNIWSAQAILVNKETIKGYIQNAVTVLSTGQLGFKIIGVQSLQKELLLNQFKPSVYSTCQFADTFIYSLGHPTYILNTPLMNGADVGLNSTFHNMHVPFHIRGFASLQEAQEQMINGIIPLPNFAKILNSSHHIDHQNYTTLSKEIPLPKDWSQFTNRFGV